MMHFQDILHISKDVFIETTMITSFVMVMMLIIEFINTQTKGNWSKAFQKSGWMQIVMTSILGLIPGCLGTYAVVSMYTHNIIGFGALVAAMIATFGDEAFILFSLNPQVTLLVMFICFGIALAVGFAIQAIFKNKSQKVKFKPFPLHTSHNTCCTYNYSLISKQLKKITFHRAIIMAGLILFIFALAFGYLSHEHASADAVDCNHEGHSHDSTDWVKITFLVVSFIALSLMVIVTDHFLEKHLWEHIIKKHFLKIFFWSFLALFVIKFAIHQFQFEEWISSNKLIILALAVSIGMIPISGPHVLFISLYLSGSIDLSILIASSVVQDGHGSLPLFAESKKSFLLVKLVNLFVGLLVGFSGYLFNW